jgi:aspartate 1-decarboxylase
MALFHGNRDMFRKFLKSKIHRATVTQADLDYEGSLTIPPDLMRAANIAPFESVHVWNVTRGTRLETYAITGEEGSRDICVNGAAAHLVRPGDLIIIATYGFITDDVADNQGVEPKVVFVDSENRIQHLGPEVAGPRRRDISGSNPTWNSCC